MVCHVEFNTFLSHLKKLFGWISFSNQSNHDVSSPEIKVEKCESHFHPRVNCYCNMKVVDMWTSGKKPKTIRNEWPGLASKENVHPWKNAQTCISVLLTVVSVSLLFIPIPTLISWLVLTLYLVAFVYLTTWFVDFWINITTERK